LAVASGIGASLAVSHTLYRTAERQWITRSETEAQRLSTVLLGWMDESYAPLSGLAALVESSHRAKTEEFLNALDGMESRATAVLLGAAAMLERDSHGRWVLAISSGNFEFLEREAAGGFVNIQPLMDFALARPNQFVLGPPVRSENGQPMSPVVLALSNVGRPMVLVGKLEYASLETALLGTSTPKGFYLTLRGKFMEAPEIWPIICNISSCPRLFSARYKPPRGPGTCGHRWSTRSANHSSPPRAAAAFQSGASFFATRCATPSGPRSPSSRWTPR